MHCMPMLRVPRNARAALAVALMIGLMVTGYFVATSSAFANPLVTRPWMDSSLTPDQRADLLLAQMTLDEKIALLHGVGYTSQNPGYAGYIAPNTRLGIPALKLEDGPAGVGDGLNGVTQLPAPIAGAASWDTTLMQQYGATLGAEEWGKGANVALAPTINIVRDPRWGRAFESLGEDPYLSGQMGASDIQGIQSQGPIAQVKHWAVYNQETNRNTAADDAIIDDRTMQEIYFPAFEAAVVKGNAGSAMCSYSTVNGQSACENSYLLNDTLKGQFGFQGFVTSDWGATHSTVASANNGLDMQMPDDSFFGAALKTAVTSGQVSMATINTMAHRILRTMFAFGLFDHPQSGTINSTVTSPQHAQFAQQAAEQGATLLKNAGPALPLDASKLTSIAVIGDDAGDDTQSAGGGSASVNAPHVVTPLQGITTRAGSGVSVQYAQGPTPDGQLPIVPSQNLTPLSGGGSGLTGEYYNNMTLSGSPVLTRNDASVNFNWNGGSPANGVNATQWSVKWLGTLTAPADGSYTFSLRSDDGSRLFINGATIIDNWRDQAPTTETGTVSLTKGQQYKIEVDYYQDGGGSSVSLGWQVPGAPSPIDQATQLAKRSDVAVVFVSDFESEGYDLSGIDLPGQQNQLVSAVAQANPNTIVVVNSGSAVTMPWVDQVKSVIEAWYPGQEDGAAIAALLFGDVNPSGHLPVTFPKSLSDAPANTPAQWPGVNGQVQYSEGVYVGYRWYDAKNITPLFPFGYGLSYTTFSYSNLVVAPKPTDYRGQVTVDLDVTNSGARAGADVVQLYLGIPATNASEPPRQLKGFQKVMLQPGQKQHVQFKLNAGDLGYWDTHANNWVVQDGVYKVMVGDGDSTATLPLQDSFEVRTTNGPRSMQVQAPSILSPGQAATVTTSFTNGGDIAVHNAQLTVKTPSGWSATATSPASFSTIDAGATVKTTWSVTAPSDAKAGSYTLTGAVSYESADGQATKPATATVTLPFASLAGAYNNIGIASKADPAPGNFDGSGYSYQSEALAQVGLTPGGLVGGVFTWPNVPAGQPDNVLTQGQTIAVSGSGTYLGFLGAATFSAQNGAGTITYTDGSAQPFTLTLADWYADSPATGTQLVATAPTWNAPPGSTFGSHPVSVYYDPVKLQAGKTVKYVTLPNDSNLHVFAMAVTNVSTLPFSSLQQAYNNVGVTDNSNPGAGNFGGAGYSFSAQALAAVGITAGGTVTHDGVNFTWPSTPAGSPDNVVPSGQVVLFSGSGSTLAFLGANNNGGASGTGTITYTDGTQQQFTVGFDDWYSNATSPAIGDELVATTSSWNAPGASHPVSVYYSAVSLQAGKTIQSLTLPNVSNMHIFAIATK